MEEKIDRLIALTEQSLRNQRAFANWIITNSSIDDNGLLDVVYTFDETNGLLINKDNSNG